MSAQVTSVHYTDFVDTVNSLYYGHPRDHDRFRAMAGVQRSPVYKVVTLS